MAAAPDELFAYLDRLGIAHKTVSHPPLFTVDESRALRGQIPGGHTKNLFLRDKKDAAFLVVALEDEAIELKSLHRLLGASGRFSFGSAAQEPMQRFELDRRVLQRHHQERRVLLVAQEQILGMAAWNLPAQRPGFVDREQ